jgi:hypothetical protein
MPTLTLLEQETALLWDPEVMVTLAVLVPVVEYVLATDAAEPESESVPLHEYAYDPVPPEGEAVHVADWPVTMDVGDTEQEPVRVGYDTVRLLLQETVLL